MARVGGQKHVGYSTVSWISALTSAWGFFYSVSQLLIYHDSLVFLNIRFSCLNFTVKDICRVSNGAVFTLIAKSEHFEGV